MKALRAVPCIQRVGRQYFAHGHRPRQNHFGKLVPNPLHLDYAAGPAKGFTGTETPPLPRTG
jgi:hypothetical protein